MSVFDSVPTTPVVLRADQPFDEAQHATVAFLARCSGRTLESYRADLRQFFQWASSVGMPPLVATRAHIELYRAWMEERALAASTVDRLLLDGVRLLPLRSPRRAASAPTQPSTCADRWSAAGRWPTVGRSLAAWRELASRARQALRAESAIGRFPVDIALQQQFSVRFIEASAGGTLDALVALLDPGRRGRLRRRSWRGRRACPCGRGRHALSRVTGLTHAAAPSRRRPERHRRRARPPSARPHPVDDLVARPRAGRGHSPRRRHQHLGLPSTSPAGRSA
jgi:hypothetical protein